MKTTTQLLFFLCCHFCSTLAIAQQYQVKIHITNVENNRLPDATININQQKIKADSLGNGVASLSAGNYFFTITAVDHYPFSINVFIDNDTTILATLELRLSLLGNVTVFSSRNVTRNQLAVQMISSAQLKKLPVILGEVDPLKTITLLPGVKGGGEASAGIYVRGGGPDQNLILLDGIPVYNPNHLFGFFSIFNGDAVKGVEVIKGGIPAEYGGRLSSVITIDTRDGNKDSLKGTGGIGLISSRLALEGPIVKGKSTFMISGRRTYIDQVAKLAVPKKVDGNGYYFYDLNAKVSYTINQNNQLQLTFYSGTDKFIYDKPEDGRSRIFNTNWGNTLAGLSWKQQVSNKLQQQTSLVYNKFALDSRLGFNTTSFLFSSGLQDKQAKSDWLFTMNNWLKIKWGAQYLWHEFTPGAGSITSGVQEFKSKITSQYAREAAAYVSTDINITPKLNIISGIRYSYFNQVGPNSRVLYGSDGVPTGATESFAKGESIAKYYYPEPRFSVLYKLSNSASIKASYTRTLQYLHLATTSGATFPSDLWIPSSKLIKPANARQLTAGYFKNFDNNRFEFSAEAYYKTMNNQIEFKPGALLLLNQNLEGEMVFGKGKAYGLELFFQKKRGKLTGWIGYTLSRAERKFDQLNGGRTFVYRYDRVHDLSVVANYPLSKKWEASAVFVYGTGNTLTMPTGRYTYNLGYNNAEGTVIFTNINQYDKVNNYRLPAYHRLDIAFTYTRKPDSKKWFKSSWNFSVYNVYSRLNPYFIYLDVNEDRLSIQGKKVYLFPVVPSITYNFSF